MSAPVTELDSGCARIQVKIVKREVKEIASGALRSISLFCHRLAFFRSTVVGRWWVLRSHIMKPSRTTLNLLETLGILEGTAASNDKSCSLYAVAVWLDNVATKEETQYVMGVFTLLSLIKDQLWTDHARPDPASASDVLPPAAHAASQPVAGSSAPGSVKGRDMLDAPVGEEWPSYGSESQGKPRLPIVADLDDLPFASDAAMEAERSRNCELGGIEMRELPDP